MNRLRRYCAVVLCFLEAALSNASIILSTSRSAPFSMAYLIISDFRDMSRLLNSMTINTIDTGNTTQMKTGSKNSVAKS